MDTKLQQIQSFLTTYKQTLDWPTSKWPAISWENQRRDVHIAFIKLIQKLELTNKELSILYYENRIQQLAALNAPEIILKPYTDNLSKLKAGKGKQSYSASLYSKSLKIIG